MIFPLMGMVKDLVGGFKTPSKIGRCPSNGIFYFMLSTLGRRKDPDGIIPPIIYPTRVVRCVDTDGFLNYGKGPMEYWVTIPRATLGFIRAQMNIYFLLRELSGPHQDPDRCVGTRELQDSANGTLLRLIL